jgi:hypothetical protein
VFLATAALLSFLFFCWSFLAPGVAFSIRRHLGSKRPVDVVVVEVREALLAKPTKLENLLKKNILPNAKAIVSAISLPPRLRSPKILTVSSSTSNKNDIQVSPESLSSMLSPYLNPVGVLEGVHLIGADFSNLGRELSTPSTSSNQQRLKLIDFGIDVSAVPVVQLSSGKRLNSLKGLLDGKVVVLTEVHQSGLSPAFRGAHWGRLVSSRDALALLVESASRGFPLQSMPWSFGAWIVVGAAVLCSLTLRAVPTLAVMPLSLILVGVILACKVLALGFLGQRLSLSILLASSSICLFLWLRHQDKRRGALVDPNLELALVTEREMAQEIRSFGVTDEFERLQSTVAGCFPNARFSVCSVRTERGAFRLLRQFSQGGLELFANAFEDTRLQGLLRMGIAAPVSSALQRSLIKTAFEAADDMRVFMCPLYYRASLFGLVVVSVPGVEDSSVDTDGLGEDTALSLVRHLVPAACELLLSHDGAVSATQSGSSATLAVELLELFSGSLELTSSPLAIASSRGWGIRYSAAMRQWLIAQKVVASESELPRSLTELLTALLPKDTSYAIVQLQRLIAQELDSVCVPLGAQGNMGVLLHGLSRTGIDGGFVAGVSAELVPINPAMNDKTRSSLK